MAKQVVWSIRAQNERKRILKYWADRNQSKSYSKKLNTLFRVAVKLIIEHPQIGKPTDLDNVRIKIVRDYLIIYELTDSSINILSIWDSRQDPKGIQKIIE